MYLYMHGHTYVFIYMHIYASQQVGKCSGKEASASIVPSVNPKCAVPARSLAPESCQPLSGDADRPEPLGAEVCCGPPLGLKLFSLLSQVQASRPQEL